MYFVPIMEPNFSAAWTVYSRYTEKGLQAHGAQRWISFIIYNNKEFFDQFGRRKTRAEKVFPWYWHDFQSMTSW
jgi:hypothetical protein